MLRGHATCPPYSFNCRSSLANRIKVFGACQEFSGACGCASSGFFMSVTVVATVVSYFASGNHLSNITLPHVLSIVGITVLAALSGKLLGLFWARWRLLRLATRMHDMIVRTKQRTVTESI